MVMVPILYRFWTKADPVLVVENIEHIVLKSYNKFIEANLETIPIFRFSSYPEFEAFEAGFHRSALRMPDLLVEMHNKISITDTLMNIQMLPFHRFSTQKVWLSNSIMGNPLVEDKKYTTFQLVSNIFDYREVMKELLIRTVENREVIEVGHTIVTLAG